MNTDKFYRVNDKIKFSPVVVIDADGTNLGPVSLFRAKELASSRNLDLVEVAPNARPPVCRVMNFGKFKYEQEKKNKTSKKNVQTKEIRISAGIADHDLETKSKSAIKFLQSGLPIKVRLELKRKEEVYKSLAKIVLDKFLEKLLEFGKITKNISSEGKFLFCTLEPKK